MTAVDWLIENLLINGFIRLTKEEHGLYKELTGLAKQMEKERIEISDEEIEESSKQFDSFTSRLFFQLGAQWYREQLKKR